MRLLEVYGAFFGWRIAAGPFRGTRYVRSSVCSTLAPKLLGTYERELNDWIEQIIAADFPTIINLGAAEGYYAVGLARRCNEARVLAFGADPDGRALILQLAARNNVAARVRVEGLCDDIALAANLSLAGSPLLIVDIEGGEIDLLDPIRHPALRACPMLVEMHESERPAAEILRKRFAASHTIEERWTTPRTVADLPWIFRILAPLGCRARLMRALSENRPGPMRWFFFRPLPRLANP